VTRRQYHPDGTPVLCDEGGTTHTWRSCGLDVNADGVLVNVRECLRCDVSQEKSYGAGSRRSWRTHRPAGQETTS
jgi:hypothetical protein